MSAKTMTDDKFRFTLEVGDRLKISSSDGKTTLHTIENVSSLVRLVERVHGKGKVATRHA